MPVMPRPRRRSGWFSGPTANGSRRSTPTSTSTISRAVRTSSSSTASRVAINWPAHEYFAGSFGDRDLVVLRAVEPNIRWKEYCSTVISVAAEVGCKMVVTFGALLGDVPHTRRVRVTGTSTDPELVDRLGLVPSRYEGPTGIVGVLQRRLPGAGRALSVVVGARAPLRRDPAEPTGDTRAARAVRHARRPSARARRHGAARRHLARRRWSAPSPTTTR